VPLLRTAFNEEQASISPDGRWFAYTADESGRDEVDAQPFPPAGGVKWQISSGGGGDARWRADGAELFYIADDRRLISVAIKGGGLRRRRRRRCSTPACRRTGAKRGITMT
jgi:Tol biopolymer transport system component